MSLTKHQLKEVMAKLKDKLSSDEEALKALHVLEQKIEGLEFSQEKKSKLTSSLGATFPLPQEVLNDPSAYAVFSDGACRGNPGPGAWGVVCQSGNGEVLFESNGLDLKTTNNRMELEGAIQSLERLFDYFKEQNLNSAVFLYSDSKYVIEGISKWVSGWKNRGWKKADGKAPENLDLWQHFDFVRSKFSKIHFIWVKGHAGHPQNEHCDRLANEALNQSGF